MQHGDGEDLSRVSEVALVVVIGGIDATAELEGPTETAAHKGGA